MYGGTLAIAIAVTEKFSVNRALEISWEYAQYTALSDSHVTSPHWRPSKATFVDWGNAPNPLALDTKPTICESEHMVAFVK